MSNSSTEYDDVQTGEFECGLAGNGRPLLSDIEPPCEQQPIATSSPNMDFIEYATVRAAVTSTQLEPSDQPVTPATPPLSPVSVPKASPAAFSSPQPPPPPTCRRDSRAVRAFQAAAAACRRLSEVGLVSGITAVTSAAASWVLPTTAYRRVSASFSPTDPEAALPPSLNAMYSSVTTPRSAPLAPVAQPPPLAHHHRHSHVQRRQHFNAQTTPPLEEPLLEGVGGVGALTATAASGGDILGATVRRYSSISATASVAVTPQRSSPLSSARQKWNSAVPRTAASPPSAKDGGGGGGGRALQPRRLVEATATEAVESTGSSPRGAPRPPPAMPQLPFMVAAVHCGATGPVPQSPNQQVPGPRASGSAPAGAEAEAAAGSDAVFKPRAPPCDGLLFLAPSARASMWSAQRGTQWSLEQYELTRKLYRGYASTVYKAACLTSHMDVVLKVYSLASLTEFLRHQVLRELHIHSRLKHPGIVQLLAAFREGDTLVLVLEYVRGGSLDQARRKLGGRMNEQWALHLVVLPLLRVLATLHRQGVVHRDVKPENILFTPDWRLKLCDFGVSILLHEERAVTRAGSSEYMAPEVNACPLKCTPADNKVSAHLSYGAAADVWSLGAVTYELLVGFTPFPGGPPPPGAKARQGPAAETTAAAAPAASASASASSASASASASRFSPTGGLTSLAFPARVSPAARSFISCCLEPHQGDRPTAEQLLQHPWVVGAQQAPPFDVAAEEPAAAAAGPACRAAGGEAPAGPRGGGGEVPAGPRGAGGEVPAKQRVAARGRD